MHSRRDRVQAQARIFNGGLKNDRWTKNAVQSSPSVRLQCGYYAQN
jgi:hypothetical protein